MNYGVDLHKGGLICITGHKAVPSLKMTLLPARKYSQTKQQPRKKETERKKERDATDWKMKCSARLIYANILHRYVNECR